jgi:hypothetical protein
VHSSYVLRTLNIITTVCTETALNCAEDGASLSKLRGLNLGSDIKYFDRMIPTIMRTASSFHSHSKLRTDRPVI